jgi:hypothetical protein
MMRSKEWIDRNLGTEYTLAPSTKQQAEPAVTTKSVSSDYFGALQIPLLRGRGFSAEDTATSLRVIIVNEALASHYFPNQDPIGKQIFIYAMHIESWGSGFRWGPILSEQLSLSATP